MADALAEAQAAEVSQRTATQTLSERLAAEQAGVIKQTREIQSLQEQVAVLQEQVRRCVCGSHMRRLQSQYHWRLVLFLAVLPKLHPVAFPSPSTPQLSLLSSSESSVRKLQDAVRRSDGELSALRQELASVSGQLQESRKAETEARNASTAAGASKVRRMGAGSVPMIPADVAPRVAPGTPPP